MFILNRLLTEFIPIRILNSVSDRECKIKKADAFVQFPVCNQIICRTSQYLSGGYKGARWRSFQGEAEYHPMEPPVSGTGYGALQPLFFPQQIYGGRYPRTAVSSEASQLSSPQQRRKKSRYTEPFRFRPLRSVETEAVCRCKNAVRNESCQS